MDDASRSFAREMVRVRSEVRDERGRADIQLSCCVNDGCIPSFEVETQMTVLHKNNGRVNAAKRHSCVLIIDLITPSSLSLHRHR